MERMASFSSLSPPPSPPATTSSLPLHGSGYRPSPLNPNNSGPYQYSTPKPGTASSSSSSQYRQDINSITIHPSDYDAFDALLHNIYEKTQSEYSPDGAVALRIATNPQPKFRIFPYSEEPGIPLLRFEENVRKLNPAVAVKIQNASVHAILSPLLSNDTDEVYIQIDPQTRIQLLPGMSSLPSAEKDQCAAFILDPVDMSLILWAADVEQIIPLYREFEDKLIKYIWRNRGKPRRVVVDSPPEYTAGPYGMDGVQRPAIVVGDVKKEETTSKEERVAAPNKKKKGGFGALFRWWKLDSPSSSAASDSEEKEGKEKRKHVLLGPFYAGCGAGLGLYFVISGISVLIEEYILDGNATRFALMAVLPVIFCVSLFFCLQLIGNLSLIFGPVAQYHQNSTYYSAVAPKPNKEVDEKLPHVTIQLPVYKESLELTIAPSIQSIKRAMQTYARQGGTSAIFVCDDGLQLISEQEREERIEFYANHNIGWVARPKHDGKEGGFKRRGKFKKASNMNYGLTLSMKLERHLQSLLDAGEEDSPSSSSDPDSDSGECLEDRAMKMAIEEVYKESGYRWKPWASNGKSLRVGEIILIIDADTVVPEDCFRDAAREMAESEEVGIIQHESDVMQVAHHYFENGITHFTRRINKCISYGCANGEVAPFVGHNAFLRWSAVQDVSFVDEEDLQLAQQQQQAGGEALAPERKMWSESNVSEDFDLALRLLLKGYTLRWATYSNGGFKEGVSLTVVDELARWQKYAYGCDEIIFNPIIQWWRKGPISRQLSGFMMSKAPVHYKIGMSSYMFSYYGIAAACIGSILNYFLLGLAPDLDRFYLKSFEILLACVVVFPGIGNVGFTLLEYRLGHRSVGGALFENLRWVLFFLFFFGGLSIHLSTAILAHMFSYDMTWGSTGKEVEKSTFWIEVPRILKNFKLSFIICFAIIVMMIIFTTSVIPIEWQIPGWNWALIIPVSLVVGCHICLPIVLNPWLMKFSY